ncbi:MAG: acetate--CoA ligase [Candidatus Acetothermia bacterium]|jgi:acetyl-CoA synthetase|nr:acetate--CoA ligase [Candidatus Acetothermia bacterium]MDH7505378.1 acetate--CoA ligase [Candidatus Acetothermia bacterium]
MEELKDIEALLVEERTFTPPEEFVERANITDPGIYEEARRDPERFWANFAQELEWFRPWKKVLEWNPPYAKWFVGGKLNISYNCLDRHVKGPRKNKAAIIWEGEPGDTRTLTYFELYREVNKFANVLKKLGVKKGDRVAIYLPMIPELPIAMLACARIGAPHSVVFSAFSSKALQERTEDSKAKLLITADGYYRGGKVEQLKERADEAAAACPSIEKVVVVKRIGREVPMQKGRDFWWDELMRDAPAYCEPEQMDSEDMLYILYTSGTTGKPKGVVHTTGGYLVGVYATMKWIFDIKEEDTFWCTADIGWVTGHSYIVYGPLAVGTTSLIYESVPNYPQPDRFWEIVEKYSVNIFYTAPTAIRAFTRDGEEWPNKHDLSSLRLLGSVGEPINPEAWMWYHRVIGKERCPIVDTWWQTETGMILISPLPGITRTKPGSATFPFPGVEAEIVDKDGRPVPPGRGGYLAIMRPWPAMLRTIYGDPARYEKYWNQVPGIYFTGDGAKKDEDGYFWIVGRIDDVINVSGHRLSTMEVESALVEHPAVVEAAAVGKSHPLKGQALTAFVILAPGYEESPALVQELRNKVAEVIGPIAKPDEIIFVPDLPKTRSGKIMRRILKDLAERRELGDTTTLRDPAIVDEIRKKMGY